MMMDMVDNLHVAKVIMKNITAKNQWNYVK
jgi:hypothetical protein